MGINLYFECKPELYDSRLCELSLMPDNDVLPVDRLRNCFELYRDSEKVLVVYRADTETIAELQNQTECNNPLSQEAVDSLGITGSYIGNVFEDIFVRYPELEGTVITNITNTEEGETEGEIVKRCEIL